MRKNRLEAFSDGVLAIIITIMVLELRVPHGYALRDLVPLIPKFLSYALSFLYVAIYWNNHHHMLHTAKYVTGGILWANMHLLFWLSLIPFTTAWMGENHFQSMPMALYGIVLLMASVAYFILQKQIIRNHGDDSILAKAIGKDFKGKASPILYALAIILSWVNPWIAAFIYILITFIWLIPDKRIEIIFDEEEVEKQ
ncbi:MAG: TMEM175 family protein [Methylococcaceae bacterium]|nr:TMEM175 family protein [Prolixibacteraceae bacterium]